MAELGDGNKSYYLWCVQETKGKGQGWLSESNLYRVGLAPSRLEAGLHDVTRVKLSPSISVVTMAFQALTSGSGSCGHCARMALVTLAFSQT